MLVGTRTQEKAVTLQETDPDLPVRVQEPSSGGVGRWEPAAGWGGTEYICACTVLLKEVTIIFIN